MKTFSVVFLFGVLFAVGMAALSPEERREFEKKILETCKETTEGATDDDVNILLEHELPTTPTAKCLATCAQEKVRIMVDGKISVDGLGAIGMKKYGDNMKAVGLFNEMIDACADVSGDEKCELSAALIECMINEAKKRGVDPKKGIEA